MRDSSVFAVFFVGTGLVMLSLAVGDMATAQGCAGLLVAALCGELLLASRGG